MRVVFSGQAISALQLYAYRYREYYLWLYQDTGIWSEDQICDQYRAESYRRVDEIIDLIDTRLSVEHVLGKNGESTLIVPWRTKYLVMRWADRGEERTVTQLEIR